MMKIQTFDIGTWLYPDSKLTEEKDFVKLDCVRNADICFQVLTDQCFEKGTKVSWELVTPEAGITVEVNELRPVSVKYNSGAVNYNATCWENVQDFVVRQAPYEVYDLTRPILDGTLWGDTGNTAFFIQVNVDKAVSVGEKDLVLQLFVGKECVDIKIVLTIHTPVLCDATETPYRMCHWMMEKFVCSNHNVERYTKEYYHYVEQYMEHMMKMRSNVVQLSVPTAVRDADGKVVDLDFSECEREAQIAQKLGFQMINSSPIAKWAAWTDSHYYLRWDEETQVESLEGYRQISLYIEKTKNFVKKYRMEDIYWQSLVDEPQLKNSVAYKSLACVFRRALPQIRILEAVETPNLVGSCDIWVVKQATYEKYKEQYDWLMERGEKLWVYACGFPANKWMNHIIDLPLSATRLIIWEGIRRGMNGYLHYGFMEFNEDKNPLYDTAWGREYHKEMRYFPPGNGHLVYTDRKEIYESVRAHVQRISAAEGELFLKLKENSPKVCNAIIDSVASNFEEYTSDSQAVENARKRLLCEMDRLCL